PGGCTMKRLMIGLAVFAAIGLCDWCPGLRADDPAKDLPKPDPTKELATVQKEWEDARRAFATSLQEAKTNEERQQILKEKQPKPAEFADRFLKLAEKYPDSMQASQAMAWIVANAGGTEAGQKALPKLKENLAA